MQVIFDPVWSWPIAVLIGCALVGVVVITYPPRIAHLPVRTRRFLFTVRLLSALTLFFGLLRPAIRFTEKDERGAQLIVLMDKSRSMTTPDGPAGATRRANLAKLIHDNADIIKKVGESIELRFNDFADEIAPAPDAEPTAEADGKFTAIGKVIDEVRKDESGKRLVGVVLMSDGAQRAIGDDDIDARAAARRFAEQKGVPINTVVFGSSDLSSVGMDLAVEDMTVDPLPFERKTVPVRGQIRVSGAAGRKVQVRLMIEDRKGKGLGQSGELVPIPASADAKPVKQIVIPEGTSLIPVDLTFIAQQAGEYKLAFDVSVVDDANQKELKTANNRLETLINVRKGGLKVRYFDIARPEATFIRRLNENAKVQLDWQMIPVGLDQAKIRIEPNVFERGAYDVYMIGDVPASVFRPMGVDLLLLLRRRLDEGAGLIMTGGQRNFGAGGYAQTPIGDYLPVMMSAAEILRPGQKAPDQQIPGPLHMRPTKDGLQHFVMQVAAGDNEEVWKRLAPLDGANRLKAAGGQVDILARATESDVSLLFANDRGKSRVMAFAGDSTWRWHLHGQKAIHQRFWEQILLWLAHKESESDQPVWVAVEPRNIAPGGKAPIRFGAQDAQRNPISDATFTVEVLTPKGERKQVTPQKAGAESLAEFANTDEPGDYWVTVTGMKDGKALGPQAAARFIVDPRDAELDNPAADPDLMREIASLTGATAVAPEDFGQFLERLLTDGIASELQRHTTRTLWDGWPFLMTFAILLSTEWYVRKKRGLV
jgi:uncharacterized membrane protein